MDSGATADLKAECSAAWAAATDERGSTMTAHEIVSREAWEAERAELLQREKEHTRMGDELARRRRELPWVVVDKEYTLQTADGSKTLVELFEGRSQLCVYHFMFGPSYEAGCPTNSSIADSFDGILPHLAARDVTMICVSRAPIEKLLDYRERMGWGFEWASSYESEFNFDFGMSFQEEATRESVLPRLDELPPIVAHNAAACGTDVVGYLSEMFGFSVFARDGEAVHQTYSTTGRGVEFLMGYYPVLDHTPSGRDEGAAFQTWLRRHDEYERG
jgi:predicted dithiol-disulfide oxidoreductase (DUF899 family)